jgi:hypothetical protein
MKEDIDQQAETIPEWAMGLDDVQNIQKPTTLQLWLGLKNYLFTSWTESKDVWNMFFIESFSDRVLEIINSNFQEGLKETSQKLEKSIVEIKSRKTAATNFGNFKLGVQSSDMSVFSVPVGDENDDSITAKRWLFSDSNANSDLGSKKNFDIVMKSQGFTPEVQILCKHINRTVQKTLTDVFYCIDQLEPQTGNNLETILLNRLKSTSVPENDLAAKTQSCTSDFVHKLVEFIQNQIDLAKDSDSTAVVLYLARICQALTSDSLSGDVRKALTAELSDKKDHDEIRNSRMRKTSTNACPQWEECRKILKESSGKALDQWILLVTRNLKETYVEHLKSDYESKNLSGICSWVEIEEQDIKIPSQTSIHVHQTLGKLCNILNHSDAHAFSRLTIKKIVGKVAAEMGSAYSELKNLENIKFSQYFATQQLFDIHFLKEILKNSDKECEHFNDFETWLQDFIDPFDFDVINSNIGKFVQKALSRVTVMYGVIYQKSNQLNRAAQTQNHYGQEVHNVIQLTGHSSSGDGAPRLQLLPISIETQMYLKNSNAHARLPDRLKSQLNFGTGFEINSKRERDGGEGLTSKLFGLFT